MDIALRTECACRKYPGTTIVTDSVTSNGLTEFIDSLGGKHFRYKRGYKNVIGKGVELNGEGVQTELMMETRHDSSLPVACCMAPSVEDCQQQASLPAPFWVIL